MVPGGLPGFVASLMHEAGFQSAEATFHRCVVTTISLSTHGLDHPGCAENLAETGGGVLMHDAFDAPRLAICPPPRKAGRLQRLSLASRYVRERPGWWICERQSGDG